MKFGLFQGTLTYLILWIAYAMLRDNKIQKISKKVGDKIFSSEFVLAYARMMCVVLWISFALRDIVNLFTKKAE